MKDNSSWSPKDQEAIFLFGLLTLSIGLFVYSCFRRRLSIFLLGISLGIGGFVGSRISQEPILVVHGLSAFLTATIRTPPLLDPHLYFPEHTVFEDHFDLLAEEVGRVLEKEEEIPLTRDTFDGENAYIGKDVRQTKEGKDVGWRFFPVLLGSTVLPEAKEKCPTLVKLLQGIPQIRSCGISILPPQTMIPQHVGYHKGFIRYMLPIEVPKAKEKVYLCVNDLQVFWSESQSMIFDDTFPHKVFNLASERRTVLYMDLDRPFMTSFHTAVHELVCALFESSSLLKREIRANEMLYNAFQ